MAEKLELRSCTQLKVWVKKWRDGEAFDVRKGVSNPLKGRQRTHFHTVEEERDYLKAQVDYLKKRYRKRDNLSQHDNYQVIEELRNLHGVTELLEIAGIPRTSYYKWRATRSLHTEKRTRDHEIREHKMAIHLAHPYFSYPRMIVALREEGYRVNHKKVYRLMKELSIQSVIRKKRKRSNYTPSVVYPNRLQRQFQAIGPQQKLVTDITFISDGTRFYYLSAIQDLFNNEIVAWQLSERNDVKLVLDTIDQWTSKRDVYWKPCSIRIKASSIRLKRTTHDWKHSASKAATLAKQPA